MKIWNFRCLKMKKKGAASIVIDPMIWIGIIVIVLGVILFGVGPKLGYFTDLAKLFPSFQQEQRETFGDELVGINLDINDNDLHYYSVNSWKVIEPINLPSYELETKEFVPRDVYNALFSFYFDLARIPENPVWDVPGNKKWTLIPNSEGKYLHTYLRIKEETKLNIPDDAVDYILTFNDELFRTDRVSDIDEDNKVSDVRYGEVITNVVDWRDQILEGKAAEKFVTLEITENGVSKLVKYRVRKQEEYVFVDLKNPVVGEQERFIDDSDQPGGTGLEEIEVNLEVALQEAVKRKGDYAENKGFVDWLYENRFISTDEYVEINGDGFFNVEEDMEFVVGVLRQRKIKEDIRRRVVEEGKKTGEEIILELDLTPVMRVFEGEGFVDYYSKPGDSGKYYLLKEGHVYYTGTALHEDRPYILLNDGLGRELDFFGTSISYTDFEEGKWVVTPRAIASRIFSGYFEFDELGNVVWYSKSREEVTVIQAYDTWHADENWVKYSR